MTSRQIAVLTFFALLTLISLQLLGVFRLFLIPILWAAILAIVFSPLHRFFLRLLRGHRNIASAIVTMIVFVVTVGPMVFFSGKLVREILDFYGKVASWILSKGTEDIVAILATSPLGGLWQQLQEKTEALNIEIVPMTVQFLQKFTNLIVGHLQQGAKNLIVYAFHYLVTLFALFFFLRDGEAMANGVKDLVPMSQENKEAVFARIEQTVSAVVRGVLVTGLTQGVLAGLAFWVLGVPFPIFLSLLIAFLAFLPLGGAAVVWLPAAATLYFGGHWGKALILFLFGALVISMVDNLVKPLVIRGKTGMPMLFLFFSVLGGLKFYGFIGVFLGPVMLALFLTLIQIFRREYSER